MHESVDPGTVGGVPDRASLDVTVVIPVYGNRPSLGPALEAVLGQRFSGTFEIVVAASADSTAQLASVPDHPMITLLTRDHRLSSAAARNLAVGVARGRYLVFTDDDVLPEPDWLEQLVGAAGDDTAVSGSIVNGTPTSPVGTAEYILDRLDLSPSRPAGIGPWHGDTANLLIPRQLFDRFGPFSEQAVGGTDTLITTRLHQAGALTFQPAARVAHLNRTSLRAMLRVQYLRGRIAAQLGRGTGPHPAKVLLVHPILAPVAAAGRLYSIYRRTSRWAPHDLTRTVLLTPLLVVSLVVWAAGLATEGAQIDRAHGSLEGRPIGT